MYVLADPGICEDDAVLHNSTVLDGYTTADDAVFHKAFNRAAVRDKGVPYLSLLVILCGCGITGNGVDGPVIMEEAVGVVYIDQIEIRLKIALEIGNRREISTVSDTSYIQIIYLGVDEL